MIRVSKIFHVIHQKRRKKDETLNKFISFADSVVERSNKKSTERTRGEKMQTPGIELVLLQEMEKATTEKKKCWNRRRLIRFNNRITHVF